MRILFIILTIFLLSNYALADEYLDVVPSAYTYQPIYDDRYVNESGDTMEGDLDLDSYKLYLDEDDDNYFYQSDSDNIKLYMGGTLVHTWQVVAATFFMLLDDGTSKVLLDDGASFLLIR